MKKVIYLAIILGFSAFVYQFMNKYSFVSDEGSTASSDLKATDVVYPEGIKPSVAKLLTIESRPGIPSEAIYVNCEAKIYQKKIKKQSGFSGYELKPWVKFNGVNDNKSKFEFIFNGRINYYPTEVRLEYFDAKNNKIGLFKEKWESDRFNPQQILNLNGIPTKACGTITTHTGEPYYFEKFYSWTNMSDLAIEQDLDLSGVCPIGEIPTGLFSNTGTSGNVEIRLTNNGGAAMFIDDIKKCSEP